MRTEMKRVQMILSGILIIALVGCAGPLKENQLLTEAQQEYQKAENDSITVLKAPVPLKEAEEYLEESTTLWENKADKTLVDHYAYLALKKTAIATETAKLNQAQDEVERAEAERKEVLLEARRAEAEAAERKANEAIAQLQEVRQEAEDARQRAEQMAERINELEASQTERGLVLTLSDVLFDFNSAALKAGSESVIQELTSFMNEYPERSILVEGHTDSIGSEQYNNTLSLQRAQSLKQALTRKGIRSGRIRVQGLGEAYPVATNMNEAGRQQNRRVEIIVSDKNGDIAQRRN